MNKTQQHNALALFDTLHRDAMFSWKIAAISAVLAVLVFPLLFMTDGIAWGISACLDGAFAVTCCISAFVSNYLRNLLRKHANTDLPVFFPKSAIAQRFVSDRL